MTIDKEQESLKQLKDRIIPILAREEQRDDKYLLTWLKATNFNVDKAEKRLRCCIDWRKANDMDTILETVEIPEEFKEKAPMAYFGTTDDEYAIWLSPAGRHDFMSRLEKYGKQTMIRYYLANMERFIKFMKENAKKDGKNVHQILEIIDLEGFRFTQHLCSKSFRQFMSELQNAVDILYPQLVYHAVIINAPKPITAIYWISKLFLSKVTLEKVSIFGIRREQWIAHLKEKQFPMHNIPAHWGGSLEGIDEFCSGHEIWFQGPKDMKAWIDSRENSA